MMMMMISDFMKIHPVGAELFRAGRRSGGQIDGRDEAASSLSQFCERA